MDWTRFACIALLFLAQGAAAQVPESGRWQDLRFDADAVASDTEDRYNEQLATLAAAGMLDRDRVLLGRIHAIAASLLRAAEVFKPEVRDWRWDFHTSSDPDVEAACMAGGKILIGSRFVDSLALDDGELAALLAHEIAHAIAEHHRETLSEALFVSGRALPLEVVEERLASDLGLQLKLTQLARLQESEADQLGMVLAHAAGWPLDGMLRFYRKLAAHGGGTALIGSHPDMRARTSMAEGMARLFVSGR